METGFRQVLLYILAGVIILGAISWTIKMFDTGLEYNRVVVEDTHHKASSRYMLPDYYSPTLYITPAEAYTDIIAGDQSILIKINGADLDYTMLSKARGGDSTAINALKGALNQSKYHKVTSYDGNKNITNINYIGE